MGLETPKAYPPALCGRSWLPPVKGKADSSSRVSNNITYFPYNEHQIWLWLLLFVSRSPRACSSTSLSTGQINLPKAEPDHTLLAIPQWFTTAYPIPSCHRSLAQHSSFSKTFLTHHSPQLAPGTSNPWTFLIYSILPVFLGHFLFLEWLPPCVHIWSFLVLLLDDFPMPELQAILPLHPPPIIGCLQELPSLLDRKPAGWWPIHDSAFNCQCLTLCPCTW